MLNNNKLYLDCVQLCTESAITVLIQTIANTFGRSQSLSSEVQGHNWPVKLNPYKIPQATLKMLNVIDP